MIANFLGVALAAAWLVLRALAPGIPYRLGMAAAFAWRILLPAGACLAAAWWRPWLGLLVAAVLLIATRIIRRRPATLRREIAAAMAAWSAALARAGAPANFADTAVHVLRQRYGHRGISHLEAATLAGRCHELDELAAQIALRDGGLPAYSAYLRRFGRTTEVRDPEKALAGTPFPGSTP